LTLLLAVWAIVSVAQHEQSEAVLTWQLLMQHSAAAFLWNLCMCGSIYKSFSSVNVSMING